MINGLHAILYSPDAEAVRAFFRDVLEFPHVDAGGGWLIFAAPPAELAAHPGDTAGRCELYLMCDDVNETMQTLTAKGVRCGEVTDAGWGLLTDIELPDGARLGLYQPRHPTPPRI